VAHCTILTNDMGFSLSVVSVASKVQSNINPSDSERQSYYVIWHTFSCLAFRICWLIQSLHPHHLSSWKTENACSGSLTRSPLMTRCRSLTISDYLPRAVHL
jgi:hypothetical protein